MFVYGLAIVGFSGMENAGAMKFRHLDVEIDSYNQSGEDFSVNAVQ